MPPQAEQRRRSKDCHRRVAILYAGGIFACRHCHNLAYESQREAPHSRALSRAQNIRVKLGGSGSMAEPFPPKPKGMRWKSYLRLLNRSEEADALSIPPWVVRHFMRGRS